MSDKKKHKKNKKRKGRLQKIRTVAAGVIFVAVTVGLCVFLAFMQNRASEYKQRENSQKVLEEITVTLQDNSNTVQLIDAEFDMMNQNLVSSLAAYMNYADVLGKARRTDQSDPAAVAAISKELCDLFEEMRRSINAGLIYVLDENGTIMICSNREYLGRNMGIAFSAKDLETIFTYETDAYGHVTKNGTATYRDGERIDSHYVTGAYYTYSTYLDSDSDGNRYYLLMSVPTDLLDQEVAGLKQIENVLRGVTVGKDGFLFAIDKKEGKFLYFDDGEHDLSGEFYSNYGLSRNIEDNNYTGYENIGGTNYFCVTREFNSSVFGNYTIIAAAETKESLLSKNINVISYTGVIFIMVSAIVFGYALILRRDIANKTIELRNKFISDYRDDVHDGKYVYTEEEIMERVNIRIIDALERQTDKRFKRIEIGTRDRKGAQAFMSLYIFTRLIPVFIIGLTLIFGVSFFSQTLMSLEDVTSMSETGINDIPVVMKQAQATNNAIQHYIDKQYVSNSKLIAYIFEESPADLFSSDVSDENVHRLFTRDEKGDRVYLEDQYGNSRFSTANSSALQMICDDNNLDFIYVYDEDGNVIATNGDIWYFTLSRNESDQSHAFWDVLDGKVNSYAQDPQADEVSGRTFQYIGNVLNYYTYQGEDGSTCYADKNDYAAFLKGTWNGNPITRHRGMVQVGIDRDEVQSLFKVTGLDYILGGMRVYGSDSFFMAFDNSDEHKVLYSPISTSIGKTSSSVGISENAFSGSFNGFQVINGVKYYQSYRPEGDYFISTAIPVSSVYGARNAISIYTLLISAAFILFISILYSLSTDKMEADYVDTIRASYRTDNAKKSFYLTTPSGKKRRTSSVESRYAKIAWDEKSPEQKLSALLLVIMTFSSALILFVLVYAMTSEKSSIFSYIFRGNWDRGWNIFAITQAGMIMLIILTVTKLVQVSVRSFCGALGARIETTGNLLVSVLKYGGIIGGFFYCLHLFGFNTTSLITSAGILSVVVGLGAQSLISDIIAGIFIVFEGEFRVGDIVTIGDFRGSVLEIGLRTTKIEEVTKNIKIFNNSSISGVINMTKESSFASVIVGIEYGESLEHVERVLKDAFPRIKKNLPKITDGPFYMGVNELGDSSVNLRIMAQCEEKDRIQLVRDLNREIYLVFNKNNINIPFPQVTLSQLHENSGKTSSEDEAEARQFVEEQWASIPYASESFDTHNNN